MVEKPSRRIMLLCAIGVIGMCAAVVLLVKVTFPSSYSLFEMTNWDPSRPHSVHVLVTDDAMHNVVFDEAFILSPGQRVERKIPSWDDYKRFNFSVTLNFTASSQFTMNLWRGQRAVIDIADPDAGDTINPCIHYYDTGVADYGNQEPVFTITNEDTNRSHTVEVTVANNTGGIIFEQEYTIPPGRDIYSPQKATFVVRQYNVTISDAGSSLQCIKEVGPYTSNCRIIISDSGLEIFKSDMIFDGTYGLPYWKGKCTGSMDRSDQSPPQPLLYLPSNDDKHF